MPFPWKSYMNGRLQDLEIRKFMDFGADNFAFSAYGGLDLAAPPSAIYSLGAGWTKFSDFDASAFASSRGITLDIPNSRLAVDLQATYILGLTFTMTHDEQNAGRTTNIRVFNETDAVAGASLPIAIGRNTPGTNFTTLIGLDVGAGDDGDFWSVELGGGDAVTGTFDAFQFYLFSIGPAKQQIGA